MSFILTVSTALELRKVYLVYTCGDISRFRRLRKIRHTLWFCGVTMPKSLQGADRVCWGWPLPFAVPERIK